MSDTEIYTKSTREKFFPDLYFECGGRRIDYVIIYSKSEIASSAQNLQRISYFLDQLRKIGIQVEHATHTKNNDLGFIKIHVPRQILVGYADANNIDLYCKTTPFPVLVKPSPFRFRRTALSYDDEQSEFYHRARESISRRQPRLLTQAERILLAHSILRDIPLDEKNSLRGLDMLKAKGVIIDSFPLHEGPSKLTPTGPLTDRQILSAFWADVINFWKEEPTDIIHKYFGPEMGFYIIFVTLFNRMLGIAAITSLIFFFFGCIISWRNLDEVSTDVCRSDKYLCPTCDPDICEVEPLRNYCSSYSTWCYDSFGTFFLGIFISLWGTVFYELWTRESNLHKIKWNVMNVEYDTSIRPGYAEKADTQVKSPITGEMEPSMTRLSLTWRYLAVIGIMAITMGIVIYFVLLTSAIQYQMYKHFNQQRVDNIQVIVHSFGSIFQALFIIIIDKVKKPASRFMTDLQNCRTQFEYDDSFIMKLWVISFFNGFTAIVYAAIFKGTFYTNPGDQQIYKDFYSFRKDICSAAGCEEDVRILILFIVFTETVLMKTTTKAVKAYLGFKSIKKKFETEKKRAQWETAFLYDKMAERAVLEHVGETIHRLTLVLFCTSLLPTLPLIIFICSYIDARVDAFVYVTLRRRPIPRRVTGLGVWCFILHFVVIVSVMINALTSVLTKNFLKMEFHYYFHGNLDTYISTSFSEFAVRDFRSTKQLQKVKTLVFCSYPCPYRYGPSSIEMKYQPTLRRFTQYAYSAGFVVVYQHVVFLLHLIISSLIPNISADAKEYYDYQTTKEKRILRKHRNQEYLTNRRSGSLFLRRVTIGENL